MTLARIPLTIVATASRQKTDGVLVGVMASDLDALEARTAERDGYDRGRLVEVVMHHWPTRTSGCACGAVALGHSFAEHVADMYEAEPPDTDHLSRPDE